MTRLENFKASMNHEQPENVILDLGGCPLSSLEGDSESKLLACMGYSPAKRERLRFGRVQRIDERILKALDIDTRSVGEIFRPSHSQAKKISNDLYLDEWGIERVYTGLYWDSVGTPPLADATVEDLERFEWPVGSSINIKEVEAHAETAKSLFEDGEYIICAEHPVYGIFELGCWMCGFEDFLVRMYTDEDFVRAFFDKVLAYQKQVIEIYYGILGPYIHYTSSGDDFAMQSNAFIGKDKFDELIKPYFAERIRYTKQFTNAYFLHHSCGNISPLLDSLIDSGVDILNPIQPTCEQMQPAELKKNFGERIVFHGGLDTQRVLPFGSRESIEESVKSLLGDLNKSGGYIFAAAHNIQSDVPPENVITMFEAARKFGRAK